MKKFNFSRFFIIPICLLACLCGIAWAEDAVEITKNDHMFPQLFTSPAAVTSMDSPPAIAQVTVNQGGGNLGIVTIDGINIPTPQEMPETGSSILRFRMKASIAAPINKMFPFPMVRQITIVPDSGDAILSIRADRKITCSAIEGGNSSQIVLRIVPKQETPAPQSPLKVAQTGGGIDPMTIKTPVTLMLRDTQLRDVFRMMAGMTDHNIICDPSVPDSTVTLTVKDVPASEVFQYLMRMNDITYATMGKTILMGKGDALAKSMGLEETRMFHVAYADIKGIPTVLTSMFNLSKPPTVDERMRNIYVTAPKSKMPEIKQIMDNLDHPGRQVMLQARIIEVRSEAKEELETALNIIYDNWWMSYNSATGVSGGYNRINQNGFYKNDTNKILKPGDINMSDMAQNSSIRLIDAGIRALEAKGDGKVLASPNVVTADGKKATIALTNNLKYISARDQAGNPTYSEEKVGPTITFTPTVGRDGIINLDVKLSTGEVVSYVRGGLGEEVPQTSTREVTSYVRVRDGEPFVVGGLFKDSKTTTKSKIPILGDLPLLGFLFRSTSDKRENSEVTMVVVPYILDVVNSSVTDTLVPLSSW